MSETTEYVLETDVTGKPLVDRTTKTISVYGTELKVPHLPKSNCKKCYGRGFLGIVGNEKVIMCNKCYPFKKRN